MFSIKRSKIARFGMFAERDIKKGEFITEYKGEKLPNKIVDNEEAFFNKRYLFKLNKTYTLDGNIEDNPAKYINHSCKPNSKAYVTGRRVLIYSIKRIKEGEEITYHYGKNYFNRFLKGKCKCEKCSNS